MSVGVACPTSSTLLLRLRVRLSQLLLWASLVFSRTCYRPCIFVNSQSFMLCVSFLLYLEFSTRVLQDFVQAGDLYSKARERRNTFQKKKERKNYVCGVQLMPSSPLIRVSFLWQRGESEPMLPSILLTTLFTGHLWESASCALLRSSFGIWSSYLRSGAPCQIWLSKPGVQQKRKGLP